MKNLKDVMIYLGYQLVPDLNHYEKHILDGDESYIAYEDHHFPCWMKKVESIDQSYYTYPLAIVDRLPCIEVEQNDL